MSGLIALLVSIILAMTGYTFSRNFTRRRLLYTPVAGRPGISGLLAGVGAGLLAAPLMALLPFVGAGSALLFGAGVGSGVLVGAGSRRVEV